MVEQIERSPHVEPEPAEEETQKERAHAADKKQPETSEEEQRRTEEKESSQEKREQAAQDFWKSYKVLKKMLAEDLQEEEEKGPAITGKGESGLTAQQNLDTVKSIHKTLGKGKISREDWKAAIRLLLDLRSNVMDKIQLNTDETGKPNEKDVRKLRVIDDMHESLGEYLQIV